MTSTIVFRIRCYVPVSVITEKYDLSFQITYHTLAFDFQTANAEEHALSAIQEYNSRQTVVLDLHISNKITSALPTIDQLISKTFHLECN